MPALPLNMRALLPGVMQELNSTNDCLFLVLHLRDTSQLQVKQQTRS